MNYSDGFKLYAQYVDYLLSKTLFIHRYAANIDKCGENVEIEIRMLFRNILPERFKVTYGYIVSASSQEEPTLSPEVDMIIVDTLVPNSIFKLEGTDGIEIVPIESVVGIFEIKRTLNAKVVKTALDHLNKITEIGVRKDDERKFLPGGIAMGAALAGGYNVNPIIGIIGLTHETKFLAPTQESLESLDKAKDLLPVDIVLSMTGGCICTTRDNNPLMNSPNKGNFSYSTVDFMTPSSIVAFGLGFILNYLQRTTGRFTEVDKYYFNKSIRLPV